MIKYELEKNIAHLQILVKQSHKEVEELALDTSGDTPAVIIYYSKKKNIFSKLFFSYDDDELNLYRRILDDIIDYNFVKSNSMV